MWDSTSISKILTKYLTVLLADHSLQACFLIESDQEILAFLDALELKILFTMLVGRVIRRQQAPPAQF